MPNKRGGGQAGFRLWSMRTYPKSTLHCSQEKAQTTYRTTAICKAAMDQKAQIDDLAARREVLEAQMAVRSQRLEAAGVGLHSNLVDAQVRCFLEGLRSWSSLCPRVVELQGFPVAHIDVATVRADRQALHMLSNDHTALTEELHRSLERLHQLRKELGRTAIQGPLRHDTRQANPVPAAHPIATSRAAPVRDGVPAATPFALVDSVAVGSPASAAGICVRTPLVDLCWGASLWACSYSKPLCYTKKASKVSRDAMLKAFCLFKEVTAQAGDQVISFGDVTSAGGSELRRVAALVQACAQLFVYFPNLCWRCLSSCLGR